MMLALYKGKRIIENLDHHRTNKRTRNQESMNHWWLMSLVFKYRADGRENTACGLWSVPENGGIMNQIWRKIDGINYLMRDGRSTKELREIFSDVLRKNPGTKLTFREWLVSYGKVYTSK